MPALITLFLFISTVANALTIATGNINGYYHTLGVEYCKGKTNCKVLQTSGTLENIKLLKEGKVDYAFIQSNLMERDLMPVVVYNENEKFHILYKGNEVKSWAELINQKNYTLDFESGTYAIFQKITEILNVANNNMVFDRKVIDKQQSFCERKTTATFYNVNESGYAGLQLKLDKRCANEYLFNEYESRVLKQYHIDVQDGVIHNQILLVKKA